MVDIDPTERCVCGELLLQHYRDKHPEEERYIREMVAQLGPLVTVKTAEGAWLVPRHFIALHGISAKAMPALATQYGFARVEGTDHGGTAHRSAPPRA